MANELKLEVGHTYRAKRPRPVFDFDGALVNDRTITHIGATSVQYDGPAVKIGSKYPSIPISKFLEWVDRDVTNELPAGKYDIWPLKRPEAS